MAFGLLGKRAREQQEGEADGGSGAGRRKPVAFAEAWRRWKNQSKVDDGDDGDDDDSFAE